MEECTTADFFQKNPEHSQIQIRIIAFLVTCPASLGGMIGTVLDSRGSWSLATANGPTSGNPRYYNTKK